MSRFAVAGFVALTVAIGMVAWRIATPARMVIESDNAVLLSGIATSAAAQAQALTPTATPYRSATPTRTPEPPTRTPLPTYAADASPGIYTVARWSPTPLGYWTVEPDVLPPCATVTPQPFRDIECEVP